MYLVVVVGSPPEFGIGFSVQGVLAFTIEDSGVVIPTGNTINGLILPLTPGSSGQSLVTNGANPQQTSWTSRVLASGTPLTSSNLVLGYGWGSATGSPPDASATISGFDSAFTVTITAGSQGFFENPTFTVTFADGAFALPPIVICQQVGGTDTISFVTLTASTTGVVFTWNSTPIPEATYIFNVLVKGLV
jgi:hypothetical protein